MQQNLPFADEVTSPVDCWNEKTAAQQSCDLVSMRLLLEAGCSSALPYVVAAAAAAAGTVVDAFAAVAVSTVAALAVAAVVYAAGPTRSFCIVVAAVAFGKSYDHA